METKEKIIEKLEKKIEGQKNAMISNICDLQEILNEMDKAMNIITYLSFLKDDLIKKDGV